MKEVGCLWEERDGVEGVSGVDRGKHKIFQTTIMSLDVRYCCMFEAKLTESATVLRSTTPSDTHNVNPVTESCVMFVLSTELHLLCGV